MARPAKEGLDYFPLDVDFFNDPKFLYIEEEFGVTGGYIALRVLALIYRNGYYIEWNDDMAVVFAKQVGNGVSAAMVKSIIIRLVDRNFFDASLFRRNSILTSKGIQKQWFFIIKQAKRLVEINPKYDLINGENTVYSEETLVYSEETLVYSEETLVYSEEMPQSKVKESKVKNMKEEVPCAKQVLHEEPTKTNDDIPLAKNNGKKKGKSIDFIDNILDLWKIEYKAARNCEYAIGNYHNERRSASNLNQYVVKRNPKMTTEETMLELQSLFRTALAVKEEFMRKRLNISYLSNKLNDYLNQFESEKNANAKQYNSNGGFTNGAAPKRTIDDLQQSILDGLGKVVFNVGNVY